VPDDDQGGRCFADTAQNIARDIFNPVGNSEAHDPEKVGSSVHHDRTLCAHRTIFNLTLCA